MGVSAGPKKIKTEQIVCMFDASNPKSYSGSGADIKNTVDANKTNTLGVTTFVESNNEVSDYFELLSPSSKISLSDLSVNPSSGGFTVCMMIQSRSGAVSSSSIFNSLLEYADEKVVKFGRYGSSSQFTSKENTTNENSVLFETTDVNADYFEWYSLVPGYFGSLFNEKIQYCKDNSLSSSSCESRLENTDYYLASSGLGTYTSPSVTDTVVSNLQTTWTVPAGVTTATAVVIGGGGGSGGRAFSNNGGGGGGGGLSYGTFSVTPGETLYIQAGAGGKGGNCYITNYYQFGVQRPSSHGTDGGDSYIKRTGHNATGNDILLLAGGGGKGISPIGVTGIGGTGGTGSQGVESDGGGNGGDGGDGKDQYTGGGGGGCGGYSGNGGDGGYGYVTQSLATREGGDGTGGAGGGGGMIAVTNDTAGNYNSGGGAGIYDATRGTGSGGDGGYSNGTDTTSKSGGSGSGGTAATGHTGRYWFDSNNSDNYDTRAVGGTYGGGGGSYNYAGGNSWIESASGGRGCVRIVWGPSRTFSTNTTVPQIIEQLNTVSVPENQWMYFCFGVTSDNKVFTSINGATKSLGTASSTWSSMTNLPISTLFGNGTNSYNSYLGHCSVYDRELSIDEIDENFTQIRKRFGI